MKHVITRLQDKVEIQLIGIGKDSEYLLENIGKCPETEDRCDESRYETLDSIAAHPIEDGVKIEVKARTNTRLDLEEAERCLDNTIERVIAATERAA